MICKWCNKTSNEILTKYNAFKHIFFLLLFVYVFILLAGATLSRVYIYIFCFLESSFCVRVFYFYLFIFLFFYILFNVIYLFFYILFLPWFFLFFCLGLLRISFFSFISDFYHIFNSKSFSGPKYLLFEHLFWLLALNATYGLKP